MSIFAMSIFDILAEQRIADAQRRGELDDLPGAGKPLVFDDDPLVDGETRSFNRILKNAGFTPTEVGLRRELAALRAELAAGAGGPQLEEMRRRVAELLIQLMESPRR